MKIPDQEINSHLMPASVNHGYDSPLMVLRTLMGFMLVAASMTCSSPHAPSETTSPSRGQATPIPNVTGLWQGQIRVTTCSGVLCKNGQVYDFSLRAVQNDSQVTALLDVTHVARLDVN